MKITIKALLINETNEQIKIIDNMMLIFSTVVRFAFKRILQGKNIGDLEKEIAYKYNLNIRQAKDAVESARQTIASQKELVKMNYENYTKKVTVIENILGDKKKNLSEKKRNALLKN
ncbi:hypothetical protein [Clostridium sp. DJ247]|uniref:hypothetical protein n=1 Tax=Clostridium sp. DJ247 TaxID=2726188 RepID=UPI001F4D0B1A|nr:hypothetical protein [Clostridium sp. DJ247]